MVGWERHNWVNDIPSHMRDWCVHDHELVDDNGEWKLSELQGPDLRYWSGESR